MIAHDILLCPLRPNIILRKERHQNYLVRTRLAVRVALRSELGLKEEADPEEVKRAYYPKMFSSKESVPKTSYSGFNKRVGLLTIDFTDLLSGVYCINLYFPLLDNFDENFSIFNET